MVLIPTRFGDSLWLCARRYSRCQAERSIDTLNTHALSSSVRLRPHSSRFMGRFHQSAHIMESPQLEQQQPLVDAPDLLSRPHGPALHQSAETLRNSPDQNLSDFVVLESPQQDNQENVRAG